MRLVAGWQAWREGVPVFPCCVCGIWAPNNAAGRPVCAYHAAAVADHRAARQLPLTFA